MDRKNLDSFEIKSADRGEVTAIIATLNVKDSDGDVTLAGAFSDGAEVAISAYNHASWGGALPVGKGRLRLDGDRVLMDGQFFMDTQSGKDTFLAVKHMGAKGQWSYGYDVLDSEPGIFKGDKVRFLKSLFVHEASPVLVGAGVGVQTISTKSRTSLPEVPVTKGVLRVHDTPTTPGSCKGLAPYPDGWGIAELRAAHAFVDTDADPELKSSYRFAHHHEGGEADLRACLVELVRGDADPGLSPEQKAGVREHLAAHLLEGDITADLKAGSLLYELAALLSATDSAMKRLSDVVAMRASKNRGLGTETSLLTGWVAESLGELVRALDTPSQAAELERLRFIRQTHDL